MCIRDSGQQQVAPEDRQAGGGSLLAYYQAEARLPPAERATRSPGGSPTHFEGAAMTPADAMIYVATHRGQGKVLIDAIDPSVTDEADPLSCDRSLDMYAEANGFREPPEWSEYDDDFLKRYREAQARRVERIDRTARELIARHDDATRASEGGDFASRPHAERQDILRRRACEPVSYTHLTLPTKA